MCRRSARRAGTAAGSRTTTGSRHLQEARELLQRRPRQSPGARRCWRTTASGSSLVSHFNRCGTTSGRRHHDSQPRAFITANAAHFFPSSPRIFGAASGLSQRPLSSRAPKQSFFYTSAGKTRYVGQAKAHPQHVASATAINMARISDWLEERPHEVTSRSAFTRLKTTADAAVGAPDARRAHQSSEGSWPRSQRETASELAPTTDRPSGENATAEIGPS